MPATATPTLPAFESYGNYASDNYGAHTLRFTDDRGSYWFSYETLVAFKRLDSPLPMRVHENDWGQTTGKHLNWIDGGSPDAKRARLSGADFRRAFADDFA